MEILSLKKHRYNKQTFPFLAMERSGAALMPSGFHYFIEQKYDDQTWYFFIDTGASSSIIDKNFAEKILHLTPVPDPGNLKFNVTDVTIEAATIHCFFFGIEGNYFCADLHFFRKSAGILIGAILGTDVMDVLDTRIDLKFRTITLFGK